MVHEKIVLYSREGEKLRTDLRYVADGNKKPVVLFLHGFKGFKDWGAFPYACEQLAKSGFVTISFNFSHNGVGDDLMNFTELDRFADNTFTREIEEVQDVIRHVEAGELPIAPSEIDVDTIGLLGHSRGAGIAILAAHLARAVRAVAVWAPVSTFDRYTERQKEKWRREGVFQVLNMRTKQVMRLNLSLLRDLEQHHDRLNIQQAAREVSALEKPFLIIAGEQDLTTPPKEAKAIADSAKGPHTELFTLPSTNHTFGTKHPFDGTNPSFDRALTKTVAFLHNYLVEHPIAAAR